jgi:hypothetical protein
VLALTSLLRRMPGVPWIILVLSGLALCYCVALLFGIFS